MPFLKVASSKKAKVVVVGSLNIDQVCRVDELPCPGETIAANEYQVFRGGKGANQAIAAQRQGAQAALIGAVGDDEQGRSYLRHLEKDVGVDVSAISQAPFPTGAALITVEELSGENTIVLAGGANFTLTRADVSDARNLVEAASVLLAQLEVPVHCVIEAVHLANRAGVPVVLNPSPMIPNFPWAENAIAYVVVNESEAADLLDFHPDMGKREFVHREMDDRRIENLIVTRGSETTLVYTRKGDFFEVEPLPVLPIDTVGAGDAFAGCLAAKIGEGSSLEDAVRAANCAGALTTLGGGAQDPIPDREKVEQHIDQIPKCR